jgi:hypothetical protein
MIINKRNNWRNDSDLLFLFQSRLQTSNSMDDSNNNNMEEDGGHIVGGTLVPFGKYPSFVSNFCKLFLCIQLASYILDFCFSCVSLSGNREGYTLHEGIY